IGVGTFFCPKDHGHIEASEVKVPVEATRRNSGAALRKRSIGAAESLLRDVAAMIKSGNSTRFTPHEVNELPTGWAPISLLWFSPSLRRSENASPLACMSNRTYILLRSPL